MKHLSAVMIIALAMLLTVSAKAQSLGETGVKATIPFAFIVADRTLPAGEYVIRSPHNYLMELMDNDATDVRILTLVQVADTTKAETGKLVFHRVGNKYFLYEAVSPTMHMAVVVPQSRLEKRVAEGEASLATTGTVYLARK
jgi:hypothetical protein